MAGIDLIPASYRAATRARTALRHIALLLAVSATVAATAGGWLAWQLRAERARMAELQSGLASLSALRQQVDALKARKTAREQARVALAALRGEHAVPVLLGALGQTVNDGVWLTSLRFEHLLRPGEAAAAATTAGPGVGEMAVEQDGKRWLLGNRVEISGAATGQAQLTGFIDGLRAQDGIAAVRFLGSSIKREASGTVIEFSAEATIGERGRAQ